MQHLIAVVVILVAIIIIWIVVRYLFLLGRNLWAKKGFGQAKSSPWDDFLRDLELSRSGGVSGESVNSHEGRVVADDQTGYGATLRNVEAKDDISIRSTPSKEIFSSINKSPTIIAHETQAGRDIFFVAGNIGSIVQNGALVPDLSFRVPLQLPQRVRHFTNRRTDLAQLLTDLQPGCLVAVCGPGGIGKTALVTEALWKLAPDNEPPKQFPDGIIFHTFYGQPQVEIALEQITLAFGEEPRPTPKAAAQRVLANRCALIVLDGAEEADNLAELQALAGRCGVLITSRRRTDATGERHDLSPLPYAEAMKLLQDLGKERALDDSAVQKICGLVGGLPLAVCLVGSHLAGSEMEAAEYLEWLQETPLQALDLKQRREKSVPLLIEHSLTQLSEGARQAFCVIGLLALAPFCQEAMEAALQVSAIEAGRLLGELVEYSLLERTQKRYRVNHPLIHTYARRRVTAPDGAGRRLAAYYLAFVRAQGDSSLEGYEQLDNERLHILHVLDDCASRRDWETVLNLVWAVDDYLDLRGYWAERNRALETGLEASRALRRRGDEAELLGRLGMTLQNLGRAKLATAYHEQALAISQKLRGRPNEGKYLSNLGFAYYTLGQNEKAIAYYKRGIKASRRAQDKYGEQLNLGNLGHVYTRVGLFERAIDAYEQALNAVKKNHDQFNEGNYLRGIGQVYLDLGQREEAVKRFEQALVISHEIGDRSGEANSLSKLGETYRKIGQLRKSIECHEQALIISREIGNLRAEGNSLGNQGNVYNDLGEVERAIEYLEKSLTISRKIGDRYGEATDLGNLGNSFYEMGQLEQALDHYQQALAISREVGDLLNQRNQLSNIGAVYLKLRQNKEAISYYEKALQLSYEVGNAIELGKCHYFLAKAYRADGQEGKALKNQRKAKVQLTPTKSITSTSKRIPGVTIDPRLIQDLLYKALDLYNLYRRTRR